MGVNYHNHASQDIYPDNLQVFSSEVTDVCKIHAELVEMNPLVFSLVLLRLGHLVSSDVTFVTSGNFYQKVSDDGKGTEASTESFLPCSLKDGCKYVGIPVGNAGDKVYSASMIQELQSSADKMQVWHKVEPKRKPIYAFLLETFYLKLCNRFFKISNFWKEILYESKELRNCSGFLSKKGQCPSVAQDRNVSNPICYFSWKNWHGTKFYTAKSQVLYVNMKSRKNEFWGEKT